MSRLVQLRLRRHGSVPSLSIVFNFFPWPDSLVWFAKDGKTSIESRKDRGLYDIVGSDDGAIVYFESERQNSAGRHTHTSVLRTQKACMAFLKSYKGLKGYYPTDARQQHTAVAVTAAAWVGSPSSALVPPRGAKGLGGSVSHSINIVSNM